MKIFHRSALLAAAAFAAAPAFAQTTPPTGNDDQSIAVADRLVPPDIIVAAGVPQYAREVGQSVTIVTRATIEQRQAVSIADLLATTPGITVSRNGPVGGFTTLHIRGAEGEQTLTIIDGVRVNDPSAPGGGFDFANLLSGSVDRVEVLRGPNSVPWGSQAIGGVVNVVTTAPSYGVQGRGNIEYGDHDSLVANAAISGANDRLSGALTATYRRSDGISSAAVGTEPDGYRQFGATGRLGINIAQDIGLDLRAYYAHSRVELDGFPAPNFTLADDPEYSTTQELYGYAGAHANFLDGRFKNRVAFTIADINRDNFDSPASTTPSFLGRGRSQRYEYQGDFKVVDQLRLVAGAEREDTRFNDGFTFASAGVTSFYGEAIVKPIRQLTVTGGVRHDQHRAYGGHTTLGADAALAFDEGTTIRASYGEGFKAPTLYQLYGDFGTTSLRPETARNFDVGVEQSFLQRRAVIAVTYFHRDTVNQIDFRGCAAADVLNKATICYNRPFGTYDNVARARAQGVEAELTLRPIDELTFTANYSYIHAENLSAGFVGNDLARRPRQTVNVSLDYKLPFGLSLGGTVSHVSDSFDDAGNTTRLDGYVLAGVRAEMPIGDHFALYGRVDNLFDERYQTVSGYGTLGRAAYGGVRVKL